MISNVLISVIRNLVNVCRKEKIKIALMGGIASSLYARPRVTYDIDAIVYLKRGDIKKFLSSLSKLGFEYDRNEPVKFIHGLPFITIFYHKYKIYADLFIAENKFQKGILNRARKTKFSKMRIDIVSPEDLILLKLQTGRERDTEDVRELLLENFNKLDFQYLKKWTTQLGVKIFLEDELKSLGLKKQL